MKIHTLFSFVLLFFILLTSYRGSSQDFRLPVYQVDTFPAIFTMIGQVDTMMIAAHVIHLQQYGTRYCNQPEAFEAQDWIQAQFEYYGLSVELQDFPSWVGQSSDNVIGTLTGKVYPDEYVIIGAHYDSYATISVAPGADDNASGTSGVIEVAKILSQYEFERSIVFCAFSAEEIGLVGSEAYASRAEQQGMNILGYFNMDMIGYQEPGTEIHTDMIAPPSAKELSDFYKDVAAIYLPGFPVEDGMMIGGDSDHTSFNNHGYMGIFPFEDSEFYSPYIHTSNDIVGPSYNCSLLSMRLTQAALASVVTLAKPYETVGFPVPEQPVFRVALFPNPAGSYVTVDAGNQGKVTAGIYSIMGTLLAQQEFEGKARFDLTSFSKGIYLVKVAGTDISSTQRLIIR